MLTNPFYIGQFKWGEDTFKGMHFPLISPELFAQAQDVLNRKRTPSPS
jgi:Recombinase